VVFIVRDIEMMDAEIWKHQKTHVDSQYGKTTLEQAFDHGLEAFTEHMHTLSEEQKSRLEAVLREYTTSDFGRRARIAHFSQKHSA
jgi:hypothetical protein